MDSKFNYMLLSRLQSDCDYYLGNGNRCARQLWAGNEQAQIDKMRELGMDLQMTQNPNG